MRKEALALQAEGHSILFLSWKREQKNHSSNQQIAAKTIAFELGSVLNNFADLNLFFSYLLLPLWWLFALKSLLVEEWDLIHAINFQSILPAIIAGKLKRKPVIYEVEDTWFDQIRLPSFIRFVFLWVDKLQMLFSTAVILIDELQIAEFGGIPNKNTVVIYDSAIDIRGLHDHHVSSSDFTLFYAGEITKYRQLNLEKLVEALNGVTGTRVIFAGKGDVSEIMQWAKSSPDQVVFVGRITYDKVLKLSINSDLLFVLRDASLPLNRFICGSKIFEAMMCGKPILVSKGTATACKVLESNCGLIVDPKSVPDIRAAVLKLKNDPELCKKLGANGRQAYQEQFNWLIMKQRLTTLYSMLLDANTKSAGC